MTDQAEIERRLEAAGLRVRGLRWLGGGIAQDQATGLDQRPYVVINWGAADGSVEVQWKYGASGRWNDADSIAAGKAACEAHHRAQVLALLEVVDDA